MNDELYEKAVSLMRSKADRACIALIQRTFMIGYNRASRIMDAMIEDGVIVRISDENGITYKVIHEKESP